MKKKIVVSVCLAAIFMVGSIGVKLFNFVGQSSSELLLENVEALTNNEINPNPKICHKPIDGGTCTCYRTGVNGKQFCSVSILAVQEYVCESPLNCIDVSVTPCVAGCKCDKEKSM